MVEHLLPTVRKVLLVGAQNGLREAVEESLPKNRFEVSATPTGAVALEFAWHTRYDAVVVAHPLVDRPTARFLGTLRSHGCACRSSAVVLLTNGHGGAEAEELIGAGANRIVPESALKRKPHIDPAVEQADLTRQVEPEGDEAFILHPGEFVLASTYEVISLPDDVASRLEGKSSLGRLGLLTHSTAGFIDPGFSGHVTRELSNMATLPINCGRG